MDQPRETKRLASDVVVAFAHYGIAIETMGRALQLPFDYVSGICQRAINRGNLQRMPPQTADDKRSANLQEVVHLRLLLDDARATIRDLSQNARLGASDLFVGIFDLTKSEAAVLGAIVTRGQLSRLALYDMVFGLRSENEQPEPKIIDVFVCKVRKKLKRHAPDVAIQTNWGAGYFMSPEHARKLLAHVSEVRSVKFALPVASDAPALVPA